jgi:hypothetical protein
MARLDEEGYYYQCDRCKSNFSMNYEAKYDEGVTSDHNWPLLKHLYANRIRPHLGEFCFKCADDIAPLLHALRDIDEVTTFSNKLAKAINEKRKSGNQNNRTTEAIACQCCQKCLGRKFGYRESNDAT